MLLTELREVIDHGENSGVEFKRDDLRPEQLAREQQAALFAAGGILHAEILPVSGSGLADLDRARLSDYLGRVLGDEVPQDDAAWLRRLCGLGLMTERAHAAPVCSISGVVLFAHRPRRLLRQAGVRWMAFAGLDVDYQALDDGVLDAPLVGLWQTDSHGALYQAQSGLIEQLMQRMQPFVTTELAPTADKLQREKHWRYAPEALRETLVNAFVHRDWTRPGELEVVAYQDRLTVTSPGALQNSMTIDKMLAGQRSARNPILVEVLRDYGLVEARGMGVRRKIVPLTREFSGRDAIFDVTDDYLRVTLPARLAA